MGYTKREDIATEPGYIAVELDTGELVSISCKIRPMENTLVFHTIARCIDQPDLCVEFKHRVPVHIVEAVGADTWARECMRLVLGEPISEAEGAPVVPPWPEDLRASVSIRSTLHPASLEGQVDAGAVL